MNEVPGDADRPNQSLQAALLDYFSAPGNYQLSLREPAILFASLREVLHVAARPGGTPAGEAAPDEDKLHEAAMFFIRAALLYPGADHYAVLGLSRRAEPKVLKDRYRLLMRLIHPDFAIPGSIVWPADAAVRVNRAYEVLSSPELRRSYDEQLAALPSQLAAIGSKAVAHAPKPPPRKTSARALRAARKAAWAFGLTGGAVAALFLAPRQEPGHLVQRGIGSDGDHIDELHAQAEVWVPPATVTRADRLPTPPAVQARPRHGASAPSAAVAPRHPASAAAPAVTPSAPAPAAAAVHPSARAAAPVAAPASRTSILQAALPQPAPAMAIADSNRAAGMVQRLPEPDRGATASHANLVTEEALPRAHAPLAASSVATASAASAAASVTTTATALPTSKQTATVALGTIASPSLIDVQPQLTQLLQLLESGSGEQLLRLLEPGARKAPAAQQLSRNYEQLVHGSRPVRLMQVQFDGESRDGVLLVTGRIRLHAGEPTIGSRGQLLLLRAEFVSRGGKTTLTALSGAAD